MSTTFLTTKDGKIIKRVLEALLQEINDLKDKKSHGSACGCVDCDHRAVEVGLMAEIGQDDDE